MNHRKGITFKQLLRKLPTDAKAEEWIVKQRWPQGVLCPRCGSRNVQTGCQHKTMPFRCRNKVCAKRFSTRTGTVMERSKIGFQDWIVAAFLVLTSLKSVSSMKLHRDLGITQKSAWFLAQRLRFALSEDTKRFSGPVEVDETYMGGKRKNMSNARRKQLAGTGRGPVGKTAVVGAKDRETNQVAARVIPSTDAATLQGFVQDHADRQATVYTDDATAYASLPLDHDAVKHSLGEHVKGDVHTNGIESLWSLLKRAHTGTFHKLSPKHLDRYVQEFVGRHNMRALDTIEQIEGVCRGMEGKRLTYRALIWDNGRKSGARATASSQQASRIQVQSARDASEADTTA